MLSHFNMQAQIADLCRQYRVQRLEVFGPAASGETNEAPPDEVDLIVEFRPGQDLGPWLTHYFQFRDALSELIGRPINLFMAGALKNERFLKEVNQTRRTLYSADESHPWMRYAGMIQTGESDASRNIDDVAYGDRT